MKTQPNQPLAPTRPSGVTSDDSQQRLELVPSPEEILAFLHDASQAFWLDSGSNVSGQGQRSFYGKEPSAVFRSQGEEVTIAREGKCETLHGDPLERFCQFLEEQRSSRPNESSGISVGYLAYDLCRYTEPVEITAFDDLGLPEIFFGFYPEYHLIDHQTGEHFQVGDGECQRETDASSAAAATTPSAPIHRSNPPRGIGVCSFSNFSRESYLAAIRDAQEYIAAGDVYQVNLSQRFTTPVEQTPQELYLALRQESPAPFGAFLKFPGFTVLSNSPERFLKLNPVTRKVQTRPIKGTRPRGETPDEDRTYAHELMTSEKDRAENIMIVDLERNDLGRVCEPGSVRVAEQCALEVFPTVFHLTSTIEGTLRRDKDLLDLLRATFPGGSITGAPKIRAMEIIDELEPTRRSVYTGCIGYSGVDGSLDLSIAIRTAIQRDGKLHFQVGGGIVADSDPDTEYQETLTKALAWERALAKLRQNENG